MPIGIALLVSLLLELLAAAASVVVRMRRARGVERQQLRWLAVSSSMVAVSFVLAAVLPVDEGWGNWLRVLPLHLSVVAVGVGAALAILRYRLYDLDVAISRAILLTVSTGVVAVAYILLVVLVGGALPDRVSDAFWPSLLATAAVALAFQPARRRIVRFADRLAFGRRAAPYEALARLGRSLQHAPGATDLMRNLAQAVAESTGARQVVAVLELPGGAEVAQGWPVEATGLDRPSTDYVVSDHGERLARVEVELPPGRQLSPAEDLLVNRLLAESALAVRNLRLERELAERVAELDRSTTALLDSRRRLLRARDEEKSRFAEALRRTVLPHLLPLPSRLAELAAGLPGDGSADAREVDLQPERDAANAALEDLRSLVRGTGRATVGQATVGQVRGGRPELFEPVRPERRLGDVGGSAGLRDEAFAGLLVVGREEQHHGRPGEGLQPPGGLEAVDAREVDVHQDEVRGQLHSRLERALAGVGLPDDLEAVGLLHDASHGTPEWRLVVNHQDPHECHPGRTSGEKHAGRADRGAGGWPNGRGTDIRRHAGASATEGAGS